MDMLGTILDLVQKFATIGCGLRIIFGVIVLANGLKDHNGPQTQAGIWQIVGGGMIVAAAVLFKQIAL